MEVKIVGEIKFKTCTLPVYRDLDEPLFKAGDVAELMDYGPVSYTHLDVYKRQQMVQLKLTHPKSDKIIFVDFKKAKRGR